MTTTPYNHHKYMTTLAGLSNLESVGGGVLECRLHFGPGYRIYLGRDGDALVILLAGGRKDRQQQDIEKAPGTLA